MAKELTPEQQQKAIVLDEKISNVMKGAALKYMDLLLKEADRLPANEFLELSNIALFLFICDK